MDDTEQSRTDTSDDPAMMDSPGAVQAEVSGASIVQVGVDGKTMLILVLLPILFAVFALAASIFAWQMSDRAYDKADIAERESRLAQYELTLMRASFNAAGLSTEDPLTHEEQ